MIIALFGVQCVGKSTIGELLAKKLNYEFYNLDLERIKYYNMTIEQMKSKWGFPYQYDKSKMIVLENLLNSCGENTIIDMSLFIYTRSYIGLFKNKNIIRILLKDKSVNITKRLVFTDENDDLLVDDGYLEKHFDYYLTKVREDIEWTRSVFSKIENKYNINGKSAEDSATEIVYMIKNNKFKYMQFKK